MTPTLNKFAARLAELQGTPCKFKYVREPQPAATIRAQHEAVGDITIYDDGDELTIDIGRKHHSHVSCYNYDRFPEAERLDMAARAAAQFVHDFMCDRVCIAVDFFGEQCVGSCHYYRAEGNSNISLVRAFAGATMGERRTARFLWSGPLAEPAAGADDGLAPSQ